MAENLERATQRTIQMFEVFYIKIGKKLKKKNKQLSRIKTSGIVTLQG